MQLQKAIGELPSEGGRLSATPPAPLPQFYSSVTLLSARDHGALKQRQANTFSFTAGARTVPLNQIEFPRAGLTFPIVFTAGTPLPLPLAVLGLRPGRNLFVDEEGTWRKETYVPAYIRRVPYILTPARGADQFALCADLTSDVFCESEGDALFEDGQPSLITRKALTFCLAYQQEARKTQDLAEKLAEHDLLISRDAAFTLHSGDKIRLPAFRVVEQSRLEQLGKAAIMDLRQAGCLAPIFQHLMSLNNWARLLDLSRADEDR